MTAPEPPAPDDIVTGPPANRVRRVSRKELKRREQILVQVLEVLHQWTTVEAMTELAEVRFRLRGGRDSVSIQALTCQACSFCACACEGMCDASCPNCRGMCTDTGSEDVYGSDEGEIGS